MAKAGKLTKAEIYYIEQNPDDKTIHEIATELDRTPRMVAKHYVVKEEASSANTEQPPAKPESPMFKLMGRHERQGKHVATIMTRAASELADATRPNRLKDKYKMSNMIHKPLSD